MKFSTIFHFILPLILSCIINNAEAIPKDQGHGFVGMKGSIIDSACTIDVNDENQLINLGPETTGELIHDGHGMPVKFFIHLTGCTLNAKDSDNHRETTFSVTFDGQNDHGLFGVAGASGFGILIIDQSGDIAQPGIALPSQTLKPGKQTLEYTLELFDDHRHFIAGSWHSTVRFKVDYN